MRTLLAYKCKEGTILMNEKLQIVSFDLKLPHKLKKSVVQDSTTYKLKWLKLDGLGKEHWFSQAVQMKSLNVWNKTITTVQDIPQIIRNKMLKDSEDTPIMLSFVSEKEFWICMK